MATAICKWGGPRVLYCREISTLAEPQRGEEGGGKWGNSAQLPLPSQKLELDHEICVNLMSSECSRGGGWLKSSDN